MVRVDVRRRTAHRLSVRPPRTLAAAPGGAAVVVHEWPGRGTPVLYWHGLGAHADGRAAARVAGTAGGRRVLAADAPGFGASAALDADGYAGTALAALAVGLLDELDAERAVFVGESWGAWVGCHAVAAAPERFAALVLLDGGYTELRDWGAAAPPSLAACLELARDRGVGGPDAWAAAFRATLQPPPVSETYPALREAGVPVLLLAAGEADDRSAPSAAERGLARFRTALPGAEVHVLAGVGHDVLAAGAARRVLAERLARYE